MQYYLHMYVCVFIYIYINTHTYLCVRACVCVCVRNRPISSVLYAFISRKSVHVYVLLYSHTALGFYSAIYRFAFRSRIARFQRCL